MFDHENANKKNMSMKRFLIKTSMFTLCLIGFLVHSYFKIRSFYNQEPITDYVNENFNLNDNDDELIKLPAISICFSGNLFRRPTSAIDPATTSLTNSQRRSSLYYHSKHQLPPNVALLDDIELQQQPQFDDDFALRRRQLFNAKHNNLQNLPRSTTNQMISVDQAFGLVSKPRFSIRCDLIKPTKQRKLTRFTDNPLACEQIAQIIESINYESDQKCFTFFSQLQQTQDVEEDDFLVYRSDLNGGNLIQIKLFFEDELLNTKSNQAKIHLLVHGNAEMPNFQQMKTYSLHSSHNYVIYFNQLLYRRENTNQTPCRIYKTEIKKDIFSLTYLQQVPTMLMDYQVMLKNHLYKMLFNSAGVNAQNVTKIDDQNEINQQSNAEIEIKKELAKSQSDCIDKCHLETNRKYCICLPAGVNVRRELLSGNDLFCDELRCIQEDLPSSIGQTSTNSNKNNVNNLSNLNYNNKNNLKKDKFTSSSTEQLERLYTISNGQFVSKRHERFKQCLIKSNCIASCEEERYDYSTNEKADLNSIVSNILSNLSLPNSTRKDSTNLYSLNKKFARNYYPDGYYYDPNYLSKQHTTTTTSKVNENNRRFSFKQPETSRTKLTSILNAGGTSNKVGGSTTFDDLTKNYKNSTFDDTRLNTSIIVQTPKRNQSTFTTSSTNRRTIIDHQQSSSSSSSSGSQLNSTATTISSIFKTESTDEIKNSIDPDSIDEIDNEDSKEFTQPSLNKHTIHGKKSFKFSTSTSPSSVNKNEKPTKTNGESIDDQLDEMPIDDNIEERHNTIKPYSSLISIRNNRNGNRSFKQRLAYSLIDLIFDLSLIAVVWLGFSIYLICDYLIYLIVIIFWHFVRFTFCLDCWLKHTKKHHRVIDSASSTMQLANDHHQAKRSSKASVSSQESEGGHRTFVKSIP